MTAPRTPPRGDADPQVFVVPREACFGGRWPHGFQPLDPAQGGRLLRDFAAHGWFANRPEAEEQPAWKQVIPYAVVLDGNRALVVERLKAQSEARLHGMRSIGIGGHIESEDGPPGEALFERAMLRELGEELTLPAAAPSATSTAPWTADLVGLVNDDSTEVGSVHVGLVYRIALAPGGAPVTVRETHKMRGAFHPLVAGRGSVWHTPDFFESWSQFLLNAGFLGLRQDPRGDVAGA